MMTDEQKVRELDRLKKLVEQKRKESEKKDEEYEESVREYLNLADAPSLIVANENLEKLKAKLYDKILDGEKQQQRKK